MSAVELLALADRCEAATGADRELDVAIKAAIYGGVALVSPFNAEWCLYRAGTTDPRGGKPFERPRNVPHEVWIADRYSASLDAAMGFVPEGWWRGFQENSGVADTARWSAWLERGGETIEVDAATPALALCAAALRARAAEGGAS